MAAPRRSSTVQSVRATGAPRKVVAPRTAMCRIRAVDNGQQRARRSSDHIEALANFVAHLFAKCFPAGRSFLLGDIAPIEDVEIFQDRVTIARHRQNAQEFGGRSAGAGHFPSADGVGAIARRKAAKLCHIGGGQRSADRVSRSLRSCFSSGPVTGIVLSLGRRCARWLIRARISFAAQCLAVRSPNSPVTGLAARTGNFLEILHPFAFAGAITPR